MLLCECQCSRAVLPSCRADCWHWGGSNAPPLPAGSAPSRTARVRIFPPFVCAPGGGQNALQPTHWRLRSALSEMSPFVLSGYSAVAKHEVNAPFQTLYDVIVESKRRFQYIQPGYILCNISMWECTGAC